MSQESTIAIDFGTSQTTAAIYNDGKVETVDFNGYMSYPSIACINKDEPQFFQNVESTTGTKFINMKLLIGRNMTDLEALDLKENRFGLAIEEGNSGLEVIVKNKRHKVYDIIRKFIKTIVDEANRKYNRTFTNAILTVPVRYGSSQREAYKKIVESVGLNVVRMLNESTAAIIGHVEDNNQFGDYSVVIYDLGGGTFDATLISITQEGHFEVKDSCGHNNIGGGLFDYKISQFIYNDIMEKHPEFEYVNEKIAMKKLSKYVRSAKESLSDVNCEETEVYVRDLFKNIPEDVDEDTLKYILTRAQLEDIISDDINVTVELVKSMLKANNNIQPRHLITVGGASAIPYVTELLKEKFFDDYSDDFVIHSLHPKEVICRGAAYCMKKNYCENILEITSYSYFFSISKGAKYEVIKKGTPIPMMNKRLPFRTSRPEQDTVETVLYRFDGDEYRAMNKIVFKLDKTYLEPGKKTPFDIVLSISDCEILKIDIKERGGNKLIYSTRVDVN